MLAAWKIRGAFIIIKFISMLLLYIVNAWSVKTSFYVCSHFCFLAHNGFLINSWVQFKINIRLEVLLTISALFDGENVWYKMTVTDGYCSLAVNWNTELEAYYIFFSSLTLFSLVQVHSHWLRIAPRYVVALALLSHILLAGPRITSFCLMLL